MFSYSSFSFQVDSIKVGFPSRLGVVTSLALHLFVSLSDMLPAMLAHEKQEPTAR